MKINKEMLIAEVLEKCPDTIDVMIKFGLHCIGCHVSTFESLEDGCKAHGMSDEDIDKLIKELNEVACEVDSSLKVSKEASAELNKLKGEGLRISSNDDKLELKILDGPEKDDIVLEGGGIRVFIEKDCENKLKGKRLHFKDGEFVIE